MNYRNEKNDNLHQAEVNRAYDALIDGGFDTGSREDTAYNVAVADAVNYFGGEDKTPAHYDMAQFECFHNVYKSDMGFRPRGTWTIASMNAWLNARPEFGYGNEGMTAEDVKREAAEELALMEKQSRDWHKAWGEKHDAEKRQMLLDAEDRENYNEEMQDKAERRGVAKSWLYDLI